MQFNQVILIFCRIPNWKWASEWVLRRFGYIVKGMDQPCNGCFVWSAISIISSVFLSHTHSYSFWLLRLLNRSPASTCTGCVSTCIFWMFALLCWLGPIRKCGCKIVWSRNHKRETRAYITLHYAPSLANQTGQLLYRVCVYSNSVSTLLLSRLFALP